MKKRVLLILSLVIPAVCSAASYSPTDAEKYFAKHINGKGFAKQAMWTASSSFWVSVVHDPGVDPNLYEQLAYGICSEAINAGISKFTVSIWDARAMSAGKLKKLASHYCK